MIKGTVVTTFVATVALAAAAACGGGTSDPSGGSSTSSSGSSSSASSSAGGASSDVPCPAPVAECGYSGTASSSSSSGTALPTPQTIAKATLFGAQCKEAGAVLSVGDFGNPAAEPPVPAQPAQGFWKDKQVQLTCSVKPSGDGFAVMSSMYYEGDSIGLNGLTPVGADGFILYVKIGSGEYKHKNCTLEYPQNGGVAAGRFWAKIACPAEAVADTCAFEAEVRLENCAAQ